MRTHDLLQPPICLESDATSKDEMQTKWQRERLNTKARSGQGGTMQRRQKAEATGRGKVQN